MSKQCEDCLDTGLLYPNGETNPSQPCPYCQHGFIEDEITYHKARIVNSDPNTVVYWVECAGIASRDITRENIPEGATVIDETHNQGKQGMFK